MEFVEWLEENAHLHSLAGTDAKYVPARVRVKNGKLHIQLEGTPFNRDYGAAIDVDIPEVEPED